MIDFLIVLLVFLWGSALMNALILVRHRQHPACRQFAWAVENDSDIKIAPDFSSKSSQPRLEPSEEEILLYFKHKQCCNLEKARCLGQQLGTQILCLPQDLAQEQLTLEPPLLLHAQMLCLFVSEECVRRLLPDPILHKLVLGGSSGRIGYIRTDTTAADWQLLGKNDRKTAGPRTLSAGQSAISVDESPLRTACVLGTVSNGITNRDDF